MCVSAWGVSTSVSGHCSIATGSMGSLGVVCAVGYSSDSSTSANGCRAAARAPITNEQLAPQLSTHMTQVEKPWHEK